MPSLNLNLDRGTLAGLAAILLWSTTVALIRSLSERVGPITAGVAVYAIGGIFCMIQLLGSKTSHHQIWNLPSRYLLGCGGLFVVYMLAIYLGIGLANDRHQVLQVGLLNYLWSALTILFSLFLLKNKWRFVLIPGTLLALTGIFLVLTEGSSISWFSFVGNVASNPVVYVLGLTAAVSWALYSNLTRRWGEKATTSGVILFIPATAIVLLLVRLFIVEAGSWSLAAGLEASCLGLATALAYAFWDIAMRKGSLVLVAAFSYFIPLLSTLLSSLYLHVTPGLFLWLGSVLIVIGSLMSWKGVSNSISEPPQSR
jgi:drug/metabolite transporter (DMT)-like permease